MEQVRFAVVGTSAIADAFVEVLQASDRARYLGSMSRSAERAASVTARLGGARPFSSLAEVCACDEVDAVYLASPNALHLDQALACIAAGKHVLVEKPLATDAAKARRVFDAARARGVVAMEAMRSVHDPAMRSIREAMGRLGRIRRASLRFGKYSSRYDEVLAGRQTNIFDARMGTGSLMDIGVYCVSAMVALFGEPDEVRAVAVSVSYAGCEATGGMIDGAGSAIARYADKVVELSYSKICDDLLPCQIEGERGTLTFGGVSVPTHGELHLRAPGAGGAGYAPTCRMDGPGEPLALAPCENNMCFELADFVACVRGELDAEPFERITVTALGIMDEVRQQTGIAFPMDEPAA